MIDDPKKNEALEALFKAARNNPNEPRPEFIERLIKDADAIAPASATGQSPLETSRWNRFTRNWLPASGLTAAAVLGVWIGLMLPETQIADTWLTNDSSDLDLAAFLPGADLSQFADPETGG